MIELYTNGKKYLIYDPVLDRASNPLKTLEGAKSSSLTGSPFNTLRYKKVEEGYKINDLKLTAAEIRELYPELFL